MTAPTERPQLAKAYDPQAFEQALYQRWLEADMFAPDGRGARVDESKPPFVVIQPPPTRA